MIDLKNTRTLSQKLFNISNYYFGTAWYDAGRVLGVSLGPPHSVRHSGPAHDAAVGYRSMWQIQRRGRWASERSVLHYAKTHAWVEARAKIPSNIMARGAKLCNHVRRGQRSHMNEWSLVPVCSPSTRPDLHDFPDPDVLQEFRVREFLFDCQVSPCSLLISTPPPPRGLSRSALRTFSQNSYRGDGDDA